jgi:hypothetical protein
MSPAAALLDRLGRPGAVRLGMPGGIGPGRLPTALPDLDAALGGGLPRGGVTELVGARSTGRTGLASRVMAGATRRGETAAWVDLEDALDPEALAAAGVLLSSLLWVRPRGRDDAFRATELLLGAGGFGLVALDLGLRPPAAHRDGRAVWTRLARAAERTRSTLLVLAPTRQAGSCAALGLEVLSRRALWSGGPGRRPLLDGVAARLAVARSRAGGIGRTVTLRQDCA